MEWIKLKDKMPIAYDSGRWDGLRSDVVALVDANKQVWAGRLYEGFLDGENFSDWVDEVHDNYIDNVEYWHPLPIVPA